MFRTGEVINERYEILSDPVMGGQALVYQALDLQDMRTVGLKVLQQINPALNARFRRELLVHAMLNHPNILRMLETEVVRVNNEQSILVCVLQWVESGMTLDRLIETSTTASGSHVPLHVLLKIMVGVAEAIAYAHAQSIIHRDLKPSNVLLEREADGSWKALVADFGTAKVMDLAAEIVGKKLTTTGNTLGTLFYMSPEQGLGNFMPGNDQWAFWVMMYEGLTGGLPFPDLKLNTCVDSWTKIQKGELTYRPIADFRQGIPNDLVLLVRRGLHPEPEMRPSMKETAHLLKDILKEQVGMAETQVCISSRPPVHDKRAETVEAPVKKTPTQEFFERTMNIPSPPPKPRTTPKERPVAVARKTPVERAARPVAVKKPARATPPENRVEVHAQSPNPGRPQRVVALPVKPPPKPKAGSSGEFVTRRIPAKRLTPPSEVRISAPAPLPAAVQPTAPVAYPPVQVAYVPVSEPPAPSPPAPVPEPVPPPQPAKPGGFRVMMAVILLAILATAGLITKDKWWPMVAGADQEKSLPAEQAPGPSVQAPASSSVPAAPTIFGGAVPESVNPGNSDKNVAPRRKRSTVRDETWSVEGLPPGTSPPDIH